MNNVTLNFLLWSYEFTIKAKFHVHEYRVLSKQRRRGTKYVTIKTNSRLFQLGKCGLRFTRVCPLGIAPKLDLRKKNLSSCVYFHLFQTTSQKKISLRSSAGTAERNIPTSVLHMQNLLFNFLKLSVFWRYFRCHLRRRCDVCKQKWIRMRFK